MAVATESRVEKLAPLRKSAMLVILLGEETSAEMMRELSDLEVKRLMQEVAKVDKVSPKEAEFVLSEFHTMVLASRETREGGSEYARRVLSRAFGEESAARIIEFLNKNSTDEVSSLGALQDSDPQQLARFLRNEHPQTIALLVSQLGTSKAAAVLAALPTNLRADVALRLAKLDRISPEAIREISDLLGRRLQSTISANRTTYGGLRAIADICNSMDPGISDEVLGEVEAQSAELADSIRQLMFVFEDILLIDDAGMRELIGRIDRKTLTLALKGTSDEIKEHFTKFLSQRAVAMLTEDMDVLGPVKIKNVEAAQREIVAAVRELERQGIVNLRGSATEQYVV